MHGWIAHLPLRGEELLDGHVEVLVAAGVKGQGPPQGQRRELLARLPRADGLVADALRLAQLRLLEPRPSAAGRSVRAAAAVAEPSLVLPSHLDHNAVAGELGVAAAGGDRRCRRRRRGAARRKPRGRQRDVAPAEGTSGAALQPRVDAVDVEGVGGAGQLLEALVVRELGEADGALERGRRRDTRARRYLMTGSAATRSGSSPAGSSAS